MTRVRKKKKKTHPWNDECAARTAADDKTATTWFMAGVLQELFVFSVLLCLAGIQGPRETWGIMEEVGEEWRWWRRQLETKVMTDATLACLREESLLVC